MHPNEKNSDSLDEQAKTDPDVREFLEILAEMDSIPNANPNPRQLTKDEEKEMLAEWDKAPPYLR